MKSFRNLRVPVVTATLAAVLAGCASGRTDVDAGLDPWRQRVAAEIPVGTDVTTAVEWFKKQGLEPRPIWVPHSKDLEVPLGSLPAKEWFCEKWMMRVLVTPSPENKVASYKFEAFGVCL